MQNYQKIKVVGKGAFGTAILYEKKNGKKVVIKEIVLSEMTSQERSSALNEVKILSTVSHRNIIRDLKTANIFLNKDGTVKVGDFGISKIMLTKVCAQTILGTPYYMSPEMCEGKSYNDKSDMWAAGCILYEMATYQKPFTATTLPALVSQIMKGETKMLPSGYTPNLSKLLKSLLEVNSEKRSSAIDVSEIYLPRVFDNLKNCRDVYIGTPIPEVSLSKLSQSNRYLIYQLKSSKKEILLNSLLLPAMVKIQSLSVSSTHFLVVCEDGILYSWGQNMHGQLGNSSKSMWCHFPHLVKSFENVKISRACAGYEFSIFLTDDGKVYSCGNDSYGCLGLGDSKNSLLPRIVGLANITEIKCGPHHVIALDINNNLFSWGKGTSGALGLGNESNCFMPTKININLKDQVKSIFCGVQCTAILLVNGVLMVCGSNFSNKLGIFEDNLDAILLLTTVTLNHKITHVSFGESHTALLVEGGYVVTMGQNTNAELGVGTTNGKIFKSPVLVKKLVGRTIKMVECGPNYTVCVCENNVLSIWGKISNNKTSNFYANNTTHQRNKSQKLGTAGDTTQSFAHYLTEINQFEVIEIPQDILALYASQHQIEKNNTLMITGLTPLSHSVLLTICTTVPLAS